MIITNEKCLLRFIFIRRLIKDKHFSSSLAWPPWITGATSLVTAGASPPQNFDCGGDRPRRPREVGAYAGSDWSWEQKVHNSSCTEEIGTSVSQFHRCRFSPQSIRIQAWLLKSGDWLASRLRHCVALINILLLSPPSSARGCRAVQACGGPCKLVPACNEYIGVGRWAMSIPGIVRVCGRSVSWKDYCMCTATSLWRPIRTCGCQLVIRTRDLMLSGPVLYHWLS